MVFLHELNHGYFGLTELHVQPVYSDYGQNPDMYGTGYNKIGTAGETVDRVNVYRKELGLPIRMVYDVRGSDNTLLFLRSTTKTNSRGKEKTKLEYFNITDPF